jgi:hypothetical protein
VIPVPGPSLGTSYGKSAATGAILAGMTSLAALTHATTHPAPAFNGLFYATAATIIPVLFLAISYQSTTWQDMGKAFGAADRAAYTATKRDSSRPWWALVLGYVLGYALGALIGAILLSGALGEILAIVALYQRRAPSHAPFLVLTATIFLTAATAAVPTLAFFRAWRDEERGNSAAKQPAPNPRNP